jgi:aminoglycoside/choline kinase family phosphotransferase
LLKVGSDSVQGPEDKDHEKTDLLNDILNAAIPACLTDELEPSRESGAWKRSVEVLSGDRIGKLLQDPQTDVSLVRMIKDHGRRVSSSPCSQEEHQAGNTLYFAAIAHALVFHGVRITKLSYADLQKSFQTLAGQGWIPRWLIALFEQAATTCQAKTT